MWRRIRTDKLYCGLDLGSQRIKAVLLKAKDAQNMEFLGAYESQTYGFHDGSVSDLGELSECIHQAMQELLHRAQVRIKDVHLGVSGNFVMARETNTTIPLIDRGTKVITQRDIKKINHQAHLLGIKVEEEILHDLPQSYMVDDMNSVMNPQGLYGRTLGVHTLMIIANVNRIRNLTKAVNEAGFDVENLFFSSYVASDVLIDEQQKKEGCVLIDVGSKQTTVFVFKDGRVKTMKKIQMGGDHFTRSIAHQLNLSFDLAEEIKKAYALAVVPDQHKDEEILVKRESHYIPIKKTDIFQAIEPQIQGLLEAIELAIKESGGLEQIHHGITMMGGGSLLTGLIERITAQVNLPARLCKLNVNTDRSFGASAIFSPSVGLAQSGFKKTLGYSIASNGDFSWAQQLVHRMKDLYQEYF